MPAVQAPCERFVMNMVRAARATLALLVALTLCSCAQPASAPPASEPGSSVSRIRVVNDSTEELRDLHLLFPEDEVVVGDVAAGAASGYVEVPQGVYGYSAFRYLHGGESVVQRVTDFVGESPLPIDDYTYLLGVDSDREDRLVLLSVLRAGPAVAGISDLGTVWVRVSNQGPDDLVGYTMQFPDDQKLHLGSVPAGATSQYTRLYAASPHELLGVEYSANGRTVTQSEPAGEGERPTGSSKSGSYTYIVSYDSAAPIDERVEQVDVVADGAP